MSIINVTGLQKTYGEGDVLVRACDNVSLTVDKGEFLAITGASGSGKSTLLHLIGGVDNFDSGKVVVDSIDISDMKEKELAEYRRKKASVIYQFFNLIGSLSVEKNILFPLLLKKETVDKDLFNEVIHLLQLQDKLKRFPNQLSGGQQQRVAIARSILTRPAVILADEPTGNLDRKNSDAVIALLKECNERYNQTILIVTHDEQIANQTKRLVKMEDGKIIHDSKAA